MIYQQQKRITTTEKLFLNWLPAAGTIAMVFSYLGNKSLQAFHCEYIICIKETEEEF